MKRFIYVVIFFVLSLIFIPSTILAAEVIRSFDVEIAAHQDGLMDVTENIVYDFGNDERHGIFRKIPLVSKVGDLYRVTEIDFNKVLRDGQEERFVREINNTEVLVKIGKADTTITGPHAYTISYTIKNGIGSNYEDHDEIYWNITGNEWEVPIQKASGKLTTDFKVLPTKVVCFTGEVGLTSQDCSFNQQLVVQTKSSLNAYEGLTVVWGFEKGTFPQSTLQNNPPVSYSVTSDVTDDPRIIKIIGYILLSIPLIANFILAPYLLFWYFKNKRKNRFGKVGVNFDIPKDSRGTRVLPAEAGSIDLHQVDQNDVVATIFDLAIRKYIKITERKKDKVLGVFGGGEDFEFHRINNSDKDLMPYEQTLLDRIFEKGKVSKLDSFKADFYNTFSEIEEQIFKSLINKKFYIKNPKTQMNFLLVLGIIVIFMGGLIIGPVLIYLSRKLNGRTALGDEMDWKIDGLKIFLKNMKRHYTFQAKNLYTVEKYIPYAIAFGFINEFMEELKVIYPNYSPTWYQGSVPFYLSSHSMLNSMNTSFTTHAPSSSSGFSGGGSSGGGGGGGGGGSW